MGQSKIGQSRETGNIGYTDTGRRQTRETGNIGYTDTGRRQTRETGNIGYTDTGRRQTKQKTHHYTRTNTNNVNKTSVLLHTTEGKN